MRVQRTLVLAVAICALLVAGGGCGDDDGEAAGPADVATDLGVGEDAEPDTGPGPEDAGGDVGADMGGAEDAGEPDAGQPPEELIGQVNVEWLAADSAFGHPELALQAVFDPELVQAGYVNAVAAINEHGFVDWLPLTTGQGAWPLPALDDLVYFEMGSDVTIPPESLRTLDAGPYVALGDDLVAHVQEEVVDEFGVSLYGSSLESATEVAYRSRPDVPLDLEIPGGVDVAPALVPGAVSLPPPVELVSHDPSLLVRLRPGKALPLRWVPGESGDTILVMVRGEVEGVVTQIPDSGEIELAHLLDQPDVLALGPWPELSLTRLRQREVQLPEGRVRVLATSRQLLFGRLAPAWDMWPRALMPGQQGEVNIGSWEQPLDPEGVWLDLGPQVTIEELRLDDPSRQVVQATVRVAADARPGKLPLRLGDVAGEAIIDAPEAGWIVVELPNGGDCETATDEGLLDDGSYVSLDMGLSSGGFDTSSCAAGDPGGGDQAIPLRLSAGQTLDARYTGGFWAAALYLARGCDDPAPVRACSQAPAPFYPVRLSFTALQDEDVLLVVDAYTFFIEDLVMPRADWIIDIERSEPAPFVLTPREALAGEATSLSLHLVGRSFEPGAEVTLAFDGPAAVAELVVPPEGGSVAQVEVVLPADADPGWETATLHLGGEELLAPRALERVGAIRTAPSCEEALVAAPLPPGRYRGDNGPGPVDDVSPDRCLGDLAEGPETIVPVDLGPAETLTASARMDDGDVVLYVVADCGDAALSCADAGATGEWEALTWSAPGAGARVYVVVDAYDPDESAPFELRLEVSR